MEYFQLDFCFSVSWSLRVSLFMNMYIEYVPPWHYACDNESIGHTQCRSQFSLFMVARTLTFNFGSLSHLLPDNALIASTLELLVLDQLDKLSESYFLFYWATLFLLLHATFLFFFFGKHLFLFQVHFLFCFFFLSLGSILAGKRCFGCSAHT